MTIGIYNQHPFEILKSRLTPSLLLRQSLINLIKKIVPLFILRIYQDLKLYKSIDQSSLFIHL